ncbi:hypothetical protein [Pedobacter sp. R-06]|uniref:hypothetical protein n=1 Tax=Pedobacter sp. R-06 TaxID=3404051 RepID=UPI003CEF9BE3
MKTKMNQFMLCALTIFCGCSKPIAADDPANLGTSLVTGKQMAAAALGRVTTVVYPGMLHSAADFTRMTTKVNAGAQPWLAGISL